MNEKLCPNCGKPNPPESEFCSNCLAPMNLESSAESSPEDLSPNWLQRIRERSQDEKPDSPPLGEFGEAENRLFDQPVAPGEIPDWLKELQNLEPPQKEEAPVQDVDWIARLHEIQAGSNQSLSQSTTFYSDEELAAMAAAAKKEESTDESEQGYSRQNQTMEEQAGHTDSDIQESDQQLPYEELPENNTSLPQSEEISPDEISPAGSQSAEESSIQQEELDTEPKMAPPPDSFTGTPVSDQSGEIDFSYPAETPAEENATYPEEIAQEIPQPFEEKSKPPLESYFESEKVEEIAGSTAELEEPLIPEGVLQPQYSRSAEYSGRLEISKSQRDSITLLKSMLVGEIQPQAPVAGRSKFSGRFLRALIGVLLLVAMGYPFFTGFTLFKPQALFSPGVVAFHNTVVNLPENAPFLIVTDFEPAFSGEMKAASTGVIDNLMMKGMNFTILSTIPSGPALARDLIDTVRPSAFAYQPEKIAVLGFIPGGTTGILDFIHNPRQAAPLLDTGAYAWTYPAAQAVNTIEDYAGVLVITENAETGRAWIEQFHGYLVDKPLLMAVSAQSAPIIRPYLDSGQLNGLISGRVEGAMYDRLMDAPPRAAGEMTSYQLGMMLAAGLIVLGGFYGILKKVVIRQPADSAEEWHAG